MNFKEIQLLPLHLYAIMLFHLSIYFLPIFSRREGKGGNYLCGQSPTAEQEPGDTDLDQVDMDWFDEQAGMLIQGVNFLLLTFLICFRLLS